MSAPYAVTNHVFNHVGLSVPDLEAACDWYEAIFGFRRIRPNRTTLRSETPDAPIFRVYGSALHKVNVAWLSCGNGVGFELFQFIDPPYTAPREFEYTRGGVFHVAITVPDPEGMGRTVCANGGKQIGETVEIDGEKALYVQDPWGNVVECLSCSYEQLLCKRS